MQNSAPNYILTHNWKIKLNRPNLVVNTMGRRKTQKIIRTGPKNATTGMCPLFKTIFKNFLFYFLNSELFLFSYIGYLILYGC